MIMKTANFQIVAIIAKYVAVVLIFVFEEAKPNI